MEPKNPLAKHLRGHPAKDVAAAFEWLRDLATADGAPPEAGIALDVWHSVTEAVRTAPPAEPAPIDKALRDIDMAACYGTEEDPDAAPEMLRTIGEIARKALAEIDSAQAEPKSRTEPAKPNDSEALVAELEGAVARAAGLHATHIGRVMSDDDYATFVRLRDEKIPRLRAALRLVLAAPPPAAPQPEAPSGWIACDERMPPLGEEVLVYLAEAPCESGNRVAFDCWDEQHEAPVSFSSATIPVGPGWDSGVEWERITHWQPLPAAPGAAPPQPAVEAGSEPVAVITECEACFTPDVCQLRGTCDHYSAEWLRIAAPPPPAVEAQPVADMPAVVQVPQGLIEAVDRVLEEAHCDCPQRLRFDDGQHLSGCPLFDLNVARLAMLAAAPPQPAVEARAVAIGYVRADGTLCAGCPPISEPDGWRPLYTVAPQPAVTDEMVEAACKTFSEESFGYSAESRREYMIRSLVMRAALVAAMGVRNG